MTSSFAPWDSIRASEIIAGLATLEGPTLPILHALQDAFGHVPDDAEPLLAEALNLSRTEIYGIVSFYHDFRRAPAGRHVLKLCRAEACQAMGGDKAAANFLAALGLDWGETTSDGRITVEAVYCLGLCACAPSAMINGEPLGRVTTETLVDLAREARGL